MCTEDAWRVLKKEIDMLLMVEKTSMQICNGEIRAGKTPCAAKISIEEICNGEWSIGGRTEERASRPLDKK
jgi:hypothetical protein